MSNGDKVKKEESIMQVIERKVSQLSELLASIKSESARLKDKMLGEEPPKDTSPERATQNGFFHKMEAWLTEMRQDALVIQENVTHLNNASD